LLAYDNVAAREIFAGSTSCDLSAPVSVCCCCRDVIQAAETDLEYETDLSQVQTSAVHCPVCSELLAALQRCDADRGKVSLGRTCSAVIVKATGLRLLRLSVDPGEHLFPLTMLVCRI
jgi:hypothetical protein